MSKRKVVFEAPAPRYVVEFAERVPLPGQDNVWNYDESHEELDLAIEAAEEAARESPNLYWRVVDTMADDD